MSELWYKYDGIIQDVSKDNYLDKKAEAEGMNDMLWRDLLAYAAATPPAWAEDCEGEKYPYPEYLEMKLRDIRESIEENMRLIRDIELADEAKDQYPDSFKDYL